MSEKVLPVIIRQDKYLLKGFFIRFASPDFVGAANHFLMPDEKTRKSGYVSYLLRFAVAAGALYLAFRGENLRDVGKTLLGVRLSTFTIALLAYMLGQLIFVIRWRMLLKVLSIEIGLLPAANLTFLGLFYNNCLPGSVGGDFLRAWYVTKHTHRRFEAALSVFVDRAIGLAGMFIMAFACYWFIPAGGRQGDFTSKLVGVDFLRKLTDYKQLIIIGCAVFAAAVIIFILTPKGRNWLNKTSKFINEHGVVLFDKTRTAARIYWGKKLIILYALVLTFACQSVSIIGIWLIGREIGAPANVKYYFIFLPVSWLLGILPISVGGAGIMEWWLKIMFVEIGVPGEQALVLALCQRFTWLIGSLPGAVIHLVGAHLPKDFSVDYDKTIN